MHQSKFVSTPLRHHTKLSITQASNIEEERKKMDIVPYDSRVGSIMCGMVCRPNLAHAIHIVRRFRANSGQVHWEALK